MCGTRCKCDTYQRSSIQACVRGYIGNKSRSRNGNRYSSVGMAIESVQERAPSSQRILLPRHLSPSPGPFPFLSFPRCSAFERHASTICHTPMAPQTHSLGTYVHTRTNITHLVPLLHCLTTSLLPQGMNLTVQDPDGGPDLKLGRWLKKQRQHRQVNAETGLNTALHCTVLHYSTVHYTTLCCTAFHSHCTLHSLRRTRLRCIVEHCRQIHQPHCHAPLCALIISVSSNRLFLPHCLFNDFRMAE